MNGGLNAIQTIIPDKYPSANHMEISTKSQQCDEPSLILPYLHLQLNYGYTTVFKWYGGR